MSVSSPRQFKAHDLYKWVWARPNTPFTLEEAVEALDWSASSATSALSRLATAYPDQFRSVAKGVYEWRSEAPGGPVEAPVQEPVEAPRAAGQALVVGGDVLLKVVSRNADGKALVLDEDGGQLYVLAPFESF